MFATNASHPDGPRGAEDFKNRLEKRIENPAEGGREKSGRARQGVGRRLIEHAVAHFRAAGMTIAKIETLEQNSIGQHLYPSVGFVEIARQIHYAMPLSAQPPNDPGSDTF